MKVLGRIVYSALFLALVVSCGKDNKSGTNNNNGVCLNGYCSNLTGLDGYGFGTVNSPYSYGNYSVNQVIAETPCVYSPYGMNNRFITQQTVTMGTVVQINDVYVGATSFGDVGVLVGNGTSQATFVGYICPRTNASQAQLVTLPTIGTTTSCRFKPIVSASVRMADGSVANFRQLDYGTSRGSRFSLCY